MLILSYLCIELNEKKESNMNYPQTKDEWVFLPLFDKFFHK